MRVGVLGGLCRSKVIEIIQALPIAEVDEFLGRVADVAAKSSTGYQQAASSRGLARSRVPMRWSCF